MADSRILIKNARLHTGEAAFENGCVLVDGERVAYAGDTASCPVADVSGAKVIDARGGIAMPGLYNAHTHAAMTLVRGVGGDLELMDWLARVGPLEDKMDADAVMWGTRLAMLEMIRRGTVGFADMYIHMDHVARAVLESGMKASLTRGCSYREGVDSVVALHKEFHGAGDGRIRVPMSLHAEYTSTPELVKYAVAAAEKMGAGFHTHISESAYEVDACKQRHGVSPVKYFRDLGALRLGTIAAHCVHLSDEDIEIFAQNPVFPVHCPASNLKLASGLARAPDMLKKGIPVGLGNDGAASNNVLDLFAEMKLASLVAKGYSRDATALPARDVIRMATAHGARAMGFADSGMLKPGMKADLILLDPDAENLLPGHDLESDIVFAAQGLNVVLTMCDGKILYDHGEFKTLDSERIRARFKEAAGRLR